MVQGEALLQRRLVGGLARGIVGIVPGGEVGIGYGSYTAVSILLVMPTRSAARGATARRAPCPGRGLDLAGVGGAYRGEPVGVEQPGLQVADPAEILDPMDGEAGLREVQLGEVAGWEDALEGEVVHGHDRAVPGPPASAR